MSPQSPPSARLLVFARAPVPGHCKTRLIPRLGARGAARWQARQLLRTLAQAVATGLPVELWTTPDTAHALFRRCRARFGLRLRRQPPGDLGRRMAYALDRALAEGAPAALLLGCDCPLLDAAQLRAALDLLATVDSVLQASEDGGYVLIGTRRPLRRALHDIAWSSGAELAQTRAALRRAGLQLAERPPLWDVDEPRDLARARRLGLTPRAG